MDFARVGLTVLSLLVSITINSNVYAWSDDARDHVNYYPEMFDNTFASSLWGACNAPEIKTKGSVTETIDVQTRDFKHPLPIRYSLHSDYKERQRDVVFVVPGVFTGLDDSQSKRLEGSLFRAGVHVVIFPNPLSYDFLEAKAHHLPGDIFNDAKALLNLIYHMELRISALGVKAGAIKMLGNSYGAFTVAIMKGLDRESRNRISQVTLTAPPFNIYDSMHALDRYLDEERHRYRIFPLFSYFRNYLSLCRKELGADLSDIFEFKVKAFLIQKGFHSYLASAISQYDKLHGTNYVPGRRRGITSKKYRQWKKNLRFANFVEQFVPDVYHRLAGDEGALEYWIGDDPDVRILTSMDDFINPGVDWFLEDRVILLPNGGHYGYRGLSWFDELIKISHR